jgi:Ser/Thr protein kinase RdoA (MazF antagonist)
MTDPDPTQEIRRLWPLAGGGGAAVEVVEVVDRRFVLKRCSSAGRAGGERRFQQTLAGAGLPSLSLFDHPALQPHELLLEFVEGSLTIGGSQSPERFARWGAAIAGMHAIRFDEPAQVDEAGEVVRTSWPGLVDRLIATGLAAQRIRAGGLHEALLAEAEIRLNALRDFAPKRFVLTHGDLHANNALLRGEEVVLFDKASRVWSWPAVFDIALIYSEGFPGARYGAARSDDDARLAAFSTAYGDLPDDEAPWLDHFALAHSLMRYPSPFVPELRQIIEAALDRCSA